MSEKNETGKDLRTQLERGLEIEKSLSGLVSDLRQRPEIDMGLWRLLIRKGMMPRAIDTNGPVHILHCVYNVSGAPMIVVEKEDHEVSILHRGSIVFNCGCKTAFGVFVGNDEVVDCCLRPIGSDKINYYHIIPRQNNVAPFFTIEDDDRLKNDFECRFMAEHGMKDRWDMSDSLEKSLGYAAETLCISGPIGDLQIGIIRCGTKLYQVVLGWAEDFNNAG